MARWGKNNVIVPLDTLINKEKENANRPIAARSCGTVGRWGKMGFTSTRTYALKALPSSLSPGQSPEIGTTPTGAGMAATVPTNTGTSSPINEAPVPKPKKFFKSRNTTAPINLLRSQFMQHHMTHIGPNDPTNTGTNATNNRKESLTGQGTAVSTSSASGIKIKIKKRVERNKSSSSIEKCEITKAEKPKKEKSDKKKLKDEKKKPKEERKKEEKSLKPETAPSRVLGRNRKQINYNEDDDSIPYQKSTKSVPTNPSDITEINALSSKEPDANESQLIDINTSITSLASPTVTHKSSCSVGNSGTEHPPIVLRISKGTSRLISTDSEEHPNSSPVHVENSEFSPPHPVKNNLPPPPSKITITALPPSSPGPAISTTEELLSVLSGEPTTNKSLNTSIITSPSTNLTSEINYEAKISPDKPPKERLKLIIKTDVLKKAAERAEKQEKKNKNKKHHHHHHHHKNTLKISSESEQFKTPSPQPGTENYDLYKQLTISPSERDFDSQSSVLGSVSSKGTARMGINGTVTTTVVPEESCVIRSRGSSDVTSDLETSQHSSLVAPPSDIELRLESMMDNEEDSAMPNCKSGNTLNKKINECRRKDINMKLKKLTEEEEPLQEDILEVLTGGNEKENIVTTNNKRQINKRITKSEVLKDEIKSPNKTSPMEMPSRRMTRGRKVEVESDIVKSQETKNDKMDEAINENVIEKPSPRAKRAFKKEPLSETVKETLVENRINKNSEVQNKGKKGAKGITVKASEPAPLVEKPFEKRKRGQKANGNIPTTLEHKNDSVLNVKPEINEEILNKNVGDVKESKSKASKETKAKEIKVKEMFTNECLPTTGRGRRAAALTKATEIEPIQPKRGRITKNNNNGILQKSPPEKVFPKIEIIASITSAPELPKTAAPPIKSYGSRKRKLHQPQKEIQLSNLVNENDLTNSKNLKSIDLLNTDPLVSPNESSSSLHNTSGTTDTSTELTQKSEKTISDDSVSISPKKKEYKINKFKRTWYERDIKNNLENEKPIVDVNEHEPLRKKSAPKDNSNNLNDNKLINNTKASVNKTNKINVNNNIVNNTTSATSESTSNLCTDNDIQEQQQNSTLNSNSSSVKLVISKKKGSIFKSRALVTDQGVAGTTIGLEKKRHVYKHTWDAENASQKAEFETKSNKNLQKSNGDSVQNSKVVDSIFDDFNEDDDDNDDCDDDEPLIVQKVNRIVRPASGQSSCKLNDNNDQIQQPNNTRNDKKSKEFYTVVRNVKAAHQIQEIGEYQEMDDDIEYILDALQPHNPISTRCLSALQLAAKCMIPAFRMHVRAHGTVTKFFKALRDSKNDLSLGLCTATIMFILAQETLNIDLDRDSLELMMNLLEVDVVAPSGDLGNFERNKNKVRELCEEIKAQGKGAHLNIDALSVGTLAMETLLSLTSKKAGDWFKEELRELGGLEHIIKTICDCCHQITDYVVNWTDILLDKLKTIERCLRVLENVSESNETNQKYILTYKKGHAVNTLFKLYKLCDSEIALYPTTESTPKDNPGVILREALVPTLKVLINLTHPFNVVAIGSTILGERTGIFDTSFHILLQAPNYVPDRCIFELELLVLLLLINLTMHTIPNRQLIMQSHAPSDFGNQFDKVPAIKALIEYFYKCAEQARLVELKTDAILENPEKNKTKSQEEVDETVTKLLQKAGHHMEHTLQASYAGILIGHLISDNKDNENIIRGYLKDNSFTDIINILEKYYNFMNLTASSEANVVGHIKSTKKLIDYFKLCDSQHSNCAKSEDEIKNEPIPSTSISTRSTPRVYKTYSQR